MDPDFPDALRAFIQEYIPDVDAAELLLLFVRNPDRLWTADEIVASVSSSQLVTAAARRHLARFEALGVVEQPQPGCFRHKSASAEIDRVVQALVKAYNERPVTLVRMIYSLRDAQLRSFANAFRLKKE